MFELFTEPARQVVVFAQDESRAFGHNYIGSEHILLGLLREEDGLAAQVLDSLEITIEEVRAQIVRLVGRGEKITCGQIPFTPRAMKVLESAVRETLPPGHTPLVGGRNGIGTGHLLLGLVRVEEGIAVRILDSLGITAEKVRAQVAALGDLHD